ncbi:MAG: 50S ribosomal protein L15 [Candidatus Moraniibacteriota bacterium]
MQIHELKASAKKGVKRVGRGGKKGTYSGKGMKGQRARSGFSQYATFEGGKTSLVGRTKKNRGFKSLKSGNLALSLDVLENKFEEGEKVDKNSLLAKKIIREKQVPKILSDGEISKKLEIEGIALSKKAQEKIEKAGGKVIQTSDKEEKAKEVKKDTSKDA